MLKNTAKSMSARQLRDHKSKKKRKKQEISLETNLFPSHLCLKLQFTLRRNLGFQRDANEANLPTVTDRTDADAALVVAAAGMTSSTRWFGGQTCPLRSANAEHINTISLVR